jgi:tungstate transport system substrate-binding protein
LRARCAAILHLRPRRRGLLHTTATLVIVLCSCTAAAERTLVLATTTSVDDSGLLAALLPAFEEANAGVNVHAVAVGSGQALALGRRGDADVLIVHSPADESAFMDAGHGTLRETVMENDFVIVGPPADPAGVRGGNDAVAALQRIAAREAPWVSRGDSSGTHRAELELRRAAAAPLNVLEVGQGMAETLAFAAERSHSPSYAASVR